MSKGKESRGESPPCVGLCRYFLLAKRNLRSWISDGFFRAIGLRLPPRPGIGPSCGWRELQILFDAFRHCTHEKSSPCGSVAKQLDIFAHGTVLRFNSKWKQFRQRFSVSFTLLVMMRTIKPKGTFFHRIRKKYAPIRTCRCRRLLTKFKCTKCSLQPFILINPCWDVCWWHLMKMMVYMYSFWQI